MKNITRRTLLRTGFFVGIIPLFTSLNDFGAYSLKNIFCRNINEFSPFPQKKPNISENYNGVVFILSNPNIDVELNKVGAMLWRYIDGRTSIHHLAEILMKSYEIEFALAHKDVSRFVMDLVDKGFLSLPESGPCYKYT